MAKEVDNGKELHQLILKQDDIALSKLFDLYSESIARKLKGWYRKVAKMDVALIYEAVSEAFLGYFHNPLTFNPNISSLHRFLEVAAERDLKNILVRENKHMEAQKAPNDVELHELFWNSISTDIKKPDEKLVFSEAMELVEKELATYFETETDIRLAKLVIAGERETEIYSAVLEIEELDIEEQRAEVKRNKDRIKKVLKRNGVEEKLKQICNG
ncbi:MAG TPA: hypothetical protein VI461_14575 [Chitinophagaceae bacterium]|nr:hypothetical protein [Chitinophagaceae bacterium]